MTTEATLDGRQHLVTLSASDPVALEDAVTDLVNLLADQPGIPVAGVAASLARRPALSRRLAVVASSTGEVVQALSEPGGNQLIRPAAGAAAAGGQLVFLFPGVGDHHPGMAVELYRTMPSFRATFDRCVAVARAELGVDLLAALDLDGPRVRAPEGMDLAALLGRDARPEGFDEPTTAQLLVFAVEYAMVELLRQVGLVPTTLLGYSLGEYVAACVAGVLPMEDAVRLVARRALLIEGTPPGAMLAVLLGAEPLRDYLRRLDEPELAVAAVDGPLLCVASGTVPAIERLERELTADGLASRRLPVRHAFHSPLLAPAEAPLEALAGEFELRPAGIPLLSNVTGTWLTAEEAVDPAYWARHMSATVQFAEGLREAWSAPDVLFLEVGPGRTLGTLALQHPSRRADGTAVSTLTGPHQGGSDTGALLAALGRAWVRGHPVDRLAVAGLRSTFSDKSLE